MAFYCAWDCLFFWPLAKQDGKAAAVQRDPDLDGLPRNRVQVVVAEVQLFQCQQVIERSLVDEHQLVVVQNEVMKLRHPAERIIAYPRQSVTEDKLEGVQWYWLQQLTF